MSAEILPCLKAEASLPDAAQPLPASAPRRGAMLRAVLQSATSIAIIGLLVGIAVWGHHTSWTLPKFAALFARTSHDGGESAEEGEAGEWCPEHNVPESECIECNSDLAPPPPDYGWCAKHGIASCPIDHPDVAQVDSPRPVTGAEAERIRSALALLPREQNNRQCKNYQRRVQVASIGTMEKAGIETTIVRESPISESIPANGEIVYDQDRIAHLASPVGGTVRRVERKVGDFVRQGEVLALIDAAEVGRAKSGLIQAIVRWRLALATVTRLQPVAEEGAIAGGRLRAAEADQQQAEANLVAAQQALVNLGLPVHVGDFNNLDAEQIAKRIQYLGLPEKTIAGLAGPREGDHSMSGNLLPLRAPLDGVVVERHIVPGEVVEPGKMVLTVANLDRVWLMLSVRQEDASHIAIGQAVLFRALDGKGSPTAAGSIAWISSEVDERTRTIKARVSLPNPGRRLRANTFGVGRIVLREEPHAVVVPSEAIHNDGDCNIVFVRDKDFLREGKPKFFHVREVRLGVSGGGATEVIAGLVPGEVIASKNSLILKAQLMKDSLGEGCACCSGKNEKIR